MTWVRAMTLCALASVWCSHASAQVVVLRIDPAAEAMSQQLEAALSEFGLMPDPGYFMEAQRQGLDPTSDQTLTMLTPPAGAALAVVPRGDDSRAVLIEFRDGRSGVSLGTASVPLRKGALAREGRRVLAAEVNARLSGERPVAAQQRTPPPVEEEQSEGEGEQAGAALRLRVFAGAGIGTRALQWPVDGETLAVETGAFLAVELGAAFAIALDDALAIGPELIYQTSLDHEVDETHVAGASDSLGIRAHRFSAVLELHIGADDDFSVAPGLGFGVRALHPEVHHLLTPSYSLAGPLARIALRIPFGSAVALRLAPELQWARVGEALQEEGVGSSGIAFGGDAALEIAASAGLRLELSHRESHAMLSSTLGDGATDVERFTTARAVWTP
jgi:hypothetical protein